MFLVVVALLISLLVVVYAEFDPTLPVVFSLGASKTGTTQLSRILSLNMNVKCCHDCERWFLMNDTSKLKYNCYTDNGDYANFKFLDENVKNAKFVLNTRMIQPWMVSMHRHIAGIRLGRNCSATGLNSDCLPHTGWLANTVGHLSWRVEMFLNSSKKAEQYFRDKNNIVIIRLEEANVTWAKKLSTILPSRSGNNNDRALLSGLSRHDKHMGYYNGTASTGKNTDTINSHAPHKLTSKTGHTKSTTEIPTTTIKMQGSNGYSYSVMRGYKVLEDSMMVGEYLHQKYCVKQSKFKLTKFQCWAFCSLYEHTCVWDTNSWYTKI